MIYGVYPAAAVDEVAGCFAFWAWLRLGCSPLWLAPGVASLALFGYLLAHVEAEHGGRAFAADGGGAICLAGGAIILGGPRS